MNNTTYDIRDFCNLEHNIARNMQKGSFLHCKGHIRMIYSKEKNTISSAEGNDIKS